MSRSHFFHELRTAARESRWLIPIPSLVLLGGVTIWHSLWLTHSAHPASAGLLTPTQRQAQELLCTVWPYVAWLVPYGILKFPDLKDAFAFWRTTPTPARNVFGSRLLIAFLTSVVMPTLLSGLALREIFPEVAGEQTLIVALNQWTYFGIGALASLMAPRHKGIGVVALMALTAIVVKQVTGDLLGAFFTRDELTGRDFTLPALRYGIPLLTPLLIIGLIRNSVAPCRPRRWLLGAAGASATCVIAGFWIKVPSATWETLPTLHATLDPVSLENSREENRRRRREIGPSDEPPALLLGRAELPSPVTDFCPEAFGNPTPGVWNDGMTSGCLGDWRPTESPRLLASVPKRENPELPVISGPWNPWSGGNDDLLRANAIALFPEADIQFGGFRGKDPVRCDWIHATDLGPRNDLAVRFTVPDSKNNDGPGSAVALAGKTLRIDSRIPGTRPNTPVICFRTPATVGGTYRTNSCVLYPEPAHEWSGQVDGESGVYLSLHLVERRGPMLPDFSTAVAVHDFPQTHAAVIYNATRRQVVFISMSYDRSEYREGVNSSPDAMPIAGVEHYEGQALRDAIPTGPKPKTMNYTDESIRRREIVEAWLKESEIIVFTHDRGRQVLLPVELSLTVPVAARP